MPVRPQFNVTELAAAGKQGRPRDRAAAAQGARSQERCRVGALEGTAAATAATEAMSSEQLNSLALRVAVGKRAQEILGALKFECCSLCSR
jgi:hypothetical protein